MNRSLYVLLFTLLSVVPAFQKSSSAETPDPFGPGTLQARALRGLPGEVAALILRAEPGGEPAMEVMALPLPAAPLPEGEPSGEAGSKRRVMVLVEIDGTSFLEINREQIARLEIYIYALKADGYQVADYRAEVTAVEVGALGEVIWQSGLKYYGELALEPGAYRLRALVRDFHSKAAVLRELSLTVPDGTAASISTPLFPDPVHREPWLPIRAWRDDLLSGILDEPVEGLRQRENRPYPFSIAEEAIRPSVRPVLIPGRSSTLYLHGSLHQEQNFELVVTEPESEPVKVIAQIPLEIQDWVEKPDGVFLEGQFQLPSDLRSGPVILHARAKNDLDFMDSSGLQGHIMGSDIRDQNLLWSDLRWRGAENSEFMQENFSDRIAEAPGKKGGRRAEKLAQEFREILTSIESVGGKTDINPILEFETRVINEGSKKASARLQIAEMQIAESLAAADPESVVPLIQLYQDLYVAYRGRRLFSLGTHSRIMMERVAELYAEKGGSQGSNIVSARALTSIGGYLQAGGLAATSQRLFRRSLELHSGSKTAMLALATGYERLGVYGRARDVLESLVAQHPELSEGWLRLATAVARLGNRELSREMLEKTLELKGPYWIRSLAYEELARIHLLFDRTDESLELLEQIQDPSPGTIVLKAYLYDRLGSPNQSLELLNGIEARSQAGPSPRKRYDGWPEDSLTKTREELKDAARIRLSRLQQAVKNLK